MKTGIRKDYFLKWPEFEPNLFNSKSEKLSKLCHKSISNILLFQTYTGHSNPIMAYFAAVWSGSSMTAVILDIHSYYKAAQFWIQKLC